MAVASKIIVDEWLIELIFNNKARKNMGLYETEFLKDFSSDIEKVDAYEKYILDDENWP